MSGCSAGGKTGDVAANGRGGECEEEIRVVDRGLAPLVWVIRKVGCERRVIGSDERGGEMIRCGL